MLKTESAVDLRPAALTVPDAENYTGVGKSKLYELAAAGRITMIKAGGRTLILRETLDAYLANCPRLHKSEAA